MMTWTRRAALGAIALLVCIMLSGCDALMEMLFGSRESAQAQTTATDWADKKGLNPVNEDGSIDTEAAGKLAGQTLTGSSGNKEADAALGTLDRVERMIKAEQLAIKGREERDPEALSEAVKLQPNDWSLRVSRSSVLLENVGANLDWVGRPNEMDPEKADELAEMQKKERRLIREAETDANYAIRLADGDPKQLKRIAEQGIREMQEVKNKLGKDRDPNDKNPAPLFRDARLCRAVHQALGTYYGALYQATGEQDAATQAKQYTETDFCSGAR